MNHFPRKPVNFIEANEELLDMQKSVASDMYYDRHGEYKGPSEDVSEAEMQPQYRTPHDRVSGNEMFRRYPDGRLDYDYARDKVVEAIHKVRDGMALTSIDKCALSCLFPAVFDYVDSGVASSIRAVNLRITHEESMKIAVLVAAHLQSEMSFMHSSHAR